MDRLRLLLSRLLVNPVRKRRCIGQPEDGVHPKREDFYIRQKEDGVSTKRQNMECSEKSIVSRL